MTGSYVRKMLIANGYVLKDVAEMLKITPQAFDSKLKSKDISVGTLMKICSVINKSVDFFISGYYEDAMKADKISDGGNVINDELWSLVKQQQQTIGDQERTINDQQKTISVLVKKGDAQKDESATDADVKKASSA